MNESRRPAVVYRVEVYRDGRESSLPPDTEMRQRLDRLEGQLRQLLDVGNSLPQVADPRSDVPWRERAINVQEVGLLLGMAPRTVLESLACRPDFPVRLTMRPATWVAGEVLEWRDANRID